MTKPPSLSPDSIWLRYIIFYNHFNPQTGRLSMQAFAERAFAKNEEHGWLEVSGRDKALCDDVDKDGHDFAELIQQRRLGRGQKRSRAVGYWGYSSESARALRAFQHQTVAIDVVHTPRAADDEFPEDKAHSDLVVLNGPDEETLDLVRMFLVATLRVTPLD